MQGDKDWSTSCKGRAESAKVLDLYLDCLIRICVSEQLLYRICLLRKVLILLLGPGSSPSNHRLAQVILRMSY